MNPRAVPSCNTLGDPVRRKPPGRHQNAKAEQDPADEHRSTPPERVRETRTCPFQRTWKDWPRPIRRRSPAKEAPGVDGPGTPKRREPSRDLRRGLESRRESVGEGNLTGVSVLPTQRGVEPGKPDSSSNPWRCRQGRATVAKADRRVRAPRKRSPEGWKMMQTHQSSAMSLAGPVRRRTKAEEDAEKGQPSAGPAARTGPQGLEPSRKTEPKVLFPERQAKPMRDGERREPLARNPPKSVKSQVGRASCRGRRAKVPSA